MANTDLLKKKKRMDRMIDINKNKRNLMEMYIFFCQVTYKISPLSADVFGSKHQHIQETKKKKMHYSLIHSPLTAKKKKGGGIF